MSDVTIESIRKSDPARLAPLRITKATVDLPEDDYDSYDVMLWFNREMSAIEQQASRSIPLPKIAAAPDAGVTLMSRCVRLTGVTPEIVEASKAELAAYVRSISEQGSVLFNAYADAHNRLLKIEFPA